MYTVKIDKDLIKNEVEPIVLKDEKQINAVYAILTDIIKGSTVKRLTIL